MLRCGALFLISLGLAGPLLAQETAPRERDTYLSSATYATLRGSTPDACAAACEADERCLAWSLTPPTFRIGPRCELKASAGKPVAQTAAISGVLREAAAPQAQPASMGPRPAPQAETRPAQASSTPRLAPMERAQPAPAGRITEAPMEEVAAPHPPQPAPSSNADRPWPGLRKQPQPEQEGERPLPIRRHQGVPAYSVQSIEPLPGDYEDVSPPDSGQ